MAGFKTRQQSFAAIKSLERPPHKLLHLPFLPEARRKSKFGRKFIRDLKVEVS